MRKILKCVMLFVLVAGSLSAFTSGAAARELISLSTASFDSGSDDYANAVTVNSSGNVIMAGYRDAADCDFQTVLYDENLVMIASAAFHYPGSTYNYAHAVAADSGGNIITAGEANCGITNWDCLIVKYDMDLVVKASATFSATADSDKIQALAFDGWGNIIAAGGIKVGDHYNLLLLKYDPNLVLRSSAAYDLSTGATGMVIDSSGYIIVSGNIWGAYDCRIMKFDPSFNLVNSTVFDAGGDDFSAGVALNSAGDIILGGERGGGSTSHAFIAKYTPDLTPISSALYNRAPGSYDNAKDITVDDSDNIVLAGDSGDDSFTLRCSSDLVVVSSAVYRGCAPKAVVVDASGNCIVVGEYTGPSDQDWFLVKYNGAPPSITSGSPSTGLPGSTISMTINGANFFPGAVVAVSGTGITLNTTNIVNTSRIELTFTIASNAPVGKRDVRITNTDGTVLVVPQAFEVISLAPAVVNSTSTAISAATGGTVTLSPVYGDLSVDIPAGTFGQDVILAVSSATVPTSNQSAVRITGIGIEISNSAGLQPNKEIVITVYYRDADIAGLEESKLSLARYESGRWIPIPTVVYADQNKLVGTVKHLSTFAVVQLAPAADLAGVRVYPNPFDPKNGALTLANLTSEADIKIYNVAGELVRTLSYASADGRALWDGKNDGGTGVASGIYLAFIKSPQGKKIIKIAVEK